jgi:C-terminal processing protease CtpA/Prc
MRAALADHVAKGDDDRLTRAEDFARVVTEQLREISRDRHLLIEWRDPNAAPSEDDRRWDERMARWNENGGVARVERREGNVALVVLDAFVEIGIARRIVADAMSSIADARAVIVDLRDNTGGDPETVAWVASYLFDATPVHLNDLWWRDTGNTTAFYTSAKVDGARYGSKKPVYVLTSARTFSAAEELAYDLQCLHRATIVGETTRGGAHPVAPVTLSPTLTIRVPTGRAINPITKTDWEGIGVAPDVKTSADAALAEAERRARS